MKQIVNLIFYLIAALLLISCSGEDVIPMNAQTKISGSVKDEQGNTYPNTSIKVVGSGTELNGATNASGNFSFNISDEGTYKVTIVPPLSTIITSADSYNVSLEAGDQKSVDFIIRPRAIIAHVVIDEIDIFGEVKNESGLVPMNPDEKIYARNVFDPPIGSLTPITDKLGDHLTLADWKTAEGTIDVNCNGITSSVTIMLQGMIPNGTYTFWLNFLNKNKTPGAVLNFNDDVVKIEPLGSGTLNVQKADSNGNISATISHASCILTEETALVLVVDYHINGNTFGSAHIPDKEDVNHMLVYFQ